MKKLIPQFLLNFYHFLLALFGALIYANPSKKIKVIGVTGTNGKTTTTEMIAKILEKAGFKVALINSIRFKIGKESKKNELRMTMPGRFFIQRFLKKATKEKCQYAILEVTSEGIKQYRHRFVNFEVIVFTNLAPEHIESHGSFENYKTTKGKLFQLTKNIHIINLDDKHAEYFLKFPSKLKIGYTLQNSAKTTLLYSKKDLAKIVRAKKIFIDKEKIGFEIENEKFVLNLRGEFNIYNALAGICVAISQGIDLKTSKEALKEIKIIPGRMEEVISKPFKVFVDYAFTPFALEKVYKDLKEREKMGKLICVLGACGGGRDKWKRPVLGKIAKKFCDKIIITNEDPYDEDPLEIIEQVAKGTNGKAKKILDRREAINRALKEAKEGDVVIITGKGCEPSICIKGKKIPWDDRKVVKEEFEKLFQ